MQNFETHGVSTPQVSKAKRVCPSCYNRLKQTICLRCKKPFRSNEDQAPVYKLDHDIQKWLFPYSQNYGDWKRLCPDCYQECRASCTEVQDRLRVWAGDSKAEFIRGYRTVKTLGRVDYTGTSCLDPEQVEHYLKLYSAQLGGNGFVKYYWEKHEERHAERVLAGYSANNNPYYRTKYTIDRWFIGYAMAVLVEPFKKRSERSYHPDSWGISSPASHRQDVKMVIIDGLNICCWANPDQLSPDISVLLTLCTALAKDGMPFFCFFDAVTPHVVREHGSDQAADVYHSILADLSSCFSEVPGRKRADEFILQKADTDNAHIISNDQYRDYETRYPWLSTEKRLIKGVVAENRLLIPDLEFDQRIRRDIDRALASLKKTVRG